MVDQNSTFGRDEQVAAVIASLLAAVPAGMVVHHVGGADSMERFAWLVDGSGAAVGWQVWMATSMIFGIVFAVFTARTINEFTNTIIMFSRTLSPIRKSFVPILHRSALGFTGWGMGLLYGHILAYGAFAWLMPIVLAIKGYNTGLPPLPDFPVIGAYLLYGMILGAVYGMLLEDPWFNPAASEQQQNAALVGGLSGGVVASAALALLAGPNALSAFGIVFGTPSLLSGTAVVIALSLVLALVFYLLLGRVIDSTGEAVMLASRRNESLRSVLIPLVERLGALPIATTCLGAVYGLALGILVFVLSVAGPLPTVGPAALVALLAYGVVLGSVYGVVMRRYTIRREAVGDRRAGAIASLVGAVPGGAFLFVLGGTEPFVGFAGLVGASGVAIGALVWVGVCLLVGLVLAVPGARTLEDLRTDLTAYADGDGLLRGAVAPIADRAALTATGGSTGLIYGLIVGELAVLLTLAGVVTLGGPPVMASFAVFGLLMGTTYGLLVEGVDLSLPSGGESPTASNTAMADGAVAGGGLADAHGADPLRDEVGTEYSPYERSGFAAWRAKRPFAGAVMLMLGGAIIGAIPIRLQLIEATSGPSMSAVGLVFASMVVACGIFALVKPELSTLVGVTGIAMSILSIVGAFGGLMIGMLVGIAGGSLCVAWQSPAIEEQGADEPTRFRWLSEGERQQW